MKCDKKKSLMAAALSPLCPLLLAHVRSRHTLPHSLAKGSQRQAFIYIYLNQSIKVRKGRGGATKCANPPVVWVFFSPALSCLGAPCVWWQRGCAVVTMMGRSRQLRGSREITAPCWQLRPATGQPTGSWQSWGLFFQLSLNLCVNLEPLLCLSASWWLSTYQTQQRNLRSAILTPPGRTNATEVQVL